MAVVGNLLVERCRTRLVPGLLPPDGAAYPTAFVPAATAFATVITLTAALAGTFHAILN
ncbi:hypothetical protein AB0I84_45510 [Streptomyces spectabilis]|uniref:hypothetical protein n=1 Tax=Streptomyces spectabilis TaxID=68270 RepID=UPI0033FB3EA1